MFPRLLCLCALLSPVATLLAVPPPADSIMGIHWYANTDSIGVGDATDVEQMTAGGGVWVTEITHVNAAVAPPWDQPAYFVPHSEKVTTGKGHSLLYRIQPYWGCNVPHPDDPYTLTDFAADARSAAQTLSGFNHVWQVGNEVNLLLENHRFNDSDNNYTGPQWQPTPAQYAETYIAVRDAIHETNASVAPATQIVLMQPNSPGQIIPGVRFMDSNEYLYRMIDAIDDKSKIDGFALHGYAEPGGANDGVDGFMESIREQIVIIDSFGLGDRPIFITEFNKHMPNTNEARIGAQFLGRAYEALHNWNEGTGGTFPGRPNPNVVSATWFVYPRGGWDEYSLLRWKSDIASSSPAENPWYSFQNTITTEAYPAGAFGGGLSTPPVGGLFAGDYLPGGLEEPDWWTPYASGTTLTQTADGLRVSTTSAGGSGGIVSEGIPLGNVVFSADFTITDSSRAGTNIPEANLEIRLREGSRGYSLTFFTDASPTNPNRIVLRRANNWTETVGGLDVFVPGDGIASGDRYRVMATADGPELTFLVFENDDPAPVLSQTVQDNAQAVGYVRLGSYNLSEFVIHKTWFSTPGIGDMDGNGVLTPSDAQAIFTCWLVAADCDETLAQLGDICHGKDETGGFSGVAPSDAQAAFRSYMGLWPCEN